MVPRTISIRAQWGAMICGAVAIVGLLIFALWRPFSSRPQPTEKAVSAPAAPSGADTKVEVDLSPEKMHAADLHVSTVQSRPLRGVRTVPGRIEYRGVLRVEVKAPVDAVVQQILVKPADRVPSGTRLAMLESPEIGLVRADVEKNASDLAVSRQAFDWAQEVSESLEALLKFLEDHPAPDVAEAEFEHKRLGDHRPQILAAYSKYHLADQLYTDTRPLADRGAVSLQLLKQRQGQRQVTQAEFQGVAEQSRFDARRQREQARTQMIYTQRLLEVSRQRLRNLLGTHAELIELSKSAADDERQLTQFYLLSPLDGTVEERLTANTQRVAAGTQLFVVANTRMLEVRADIRERDWMALTLSPGQEVRVRVPALDNRELPARLEYIGRSLAADSQSLPLVAVIDNLDQLMKPGLFAWVDLPLEQQGSALVVPASAVLMHEGQRFVFVAEGPHTFRRVNVTTGAETNEGIAVLAGLQAAQRVVDRGAFLLKSELLLEPEED